MRVLDACAGIGGFSLAATWHGMEIAGQIEIDPWCRRVLAKHWPDVPRMSDVFEVRGDEFGPIDLFTAGIPCQPYSVAGKRLGATDDRAIWPAVHSIIAVARPTWLVIENVAGFIGMALDGVSADLEASGYEVRAFVLPAASVNAPHRRDRVWIVAHAGSGEGEQRHDADVLGRWPDDAEQTRLGGGALADADDAGRREHRGAVAAPAQLASAEHGGPHADADGNGWHQDAGELAACLAEAPRQAGHAGEAESRLGLRPDGVSPRLDRPEPVRFGPDWEAGIPRVTAGCPDRVNKLKALGNSIVPLVAYEILDAMLTAA